MNWKNNIKTNLIDSDLSNKLISIISLFLEKEKFILENDLNERTISNKLAQYFQKEFSDYDVDCEYNRMESGLIEGSYIEKRLHLEIEETKSDDKKGTTVYPDIIIHKRGYNEDNYLVIEVKKKKYAEDKRRASNETYREFDFRKLKAYISELKYKIGIYIEFDGNTISMLEFFRKDIAI